MKGPFNDNKTKTAVIISLNFRVAHTSHLVASYKQMEELGYKSTLFISKELISFLPSHISYITSFDQLENATVAIFWFPAFKNLSLVKKLKHKFKTKILYVFHEPVEKFSAYRKAGFSLPETLKIYAKYSFNLLLVKVSDIIILPSQKAIELYKNSFALNLNKNIIYLPLLFDDEACGNINTKREYLSYIGTISEDHAYQEFIAFIKTSASDDTFPQSIKFLIATRNNVERTRELSKLENEGRLTIIDGNPLTDEQINKAYSQSYIVWNAYHRTTQSGVLAKASMFGTPAIILKKNASEFTIIGDNVIAVTDNTDYSQIKECVLEVYSNFEKFSINSRSLFNNCFYYKTHNETILSKISLM